MDGMGGWVAVEPAILFDGQFVFLIVVLSEVG